MHLPNIFKKAAKGFEFKEGEWSSFVKSFKFDLLSKAQKRVTFGQIMSFRK